MGGSASVKVQPQPERTNFNRLAKLLVEGGTKALQDVFDSIHPPASLPLVLDSSKIRKKLQKARPNQPQWNLLYPSNNNYGRSEDFDVNLLVLLLKSICFLTPPETGWEELPIPSDNSTSADIVRLKYFRNKLCVHSLEQSVSDAEFETLWREIADTVLRLTRTVGTGKEREMRSIIASMLESPLIPENIKQNVAELKDWYHRDLESKVLVDRAVQTVRQKAQLPSVDRHILEANITEEVIPVIQRQLKKSIQRQLKLLCTDLKDDNRNILLSLEQKVEDLSAGKDMELMIRELLRTVLEEQTTELCRHLREIQGESEKRVVSVERNDCGLGPNKKELMSMIHEEVKAVAEWQTTEMKQHLDSRIETIIARARSVTSPPESAGMSEKRGEEIAEHQESTETENDVNPLHLACVEGDMSLMNVRLDEGMSCIDERGNNQMTPLMAAAAFGQADAVKLLLSRGANPHLLQEKNWSALHFASTNEDATATKILLDAGVDIHGETSDGGTALMVAAHCGRINPVRELLSRGANIHAVDEDGWNTLHHACKTDNIGIVDLLLKAGIDINLQTDDGQTAADIAKSCGCKSIVKFLRSRLGVGLSAPQID